MEYLKPFLIGGSVIAGSKYISKYANPALAPLIGGMPTGIIASYFLQTDKDKRNFYHGYAISAPILALAIEFIFIMTSQIQTIPVNIISTIGLLVWGVLSFTTIRLLHIGENK